MSKKNGTRAAAGQEEKPPEQEQLDEETPESEEGGTSPGAAPDEGSGADAEAGGPEVAPEVREGDRPETQGEDAGTSHDGGDGSGEESVAAPPDVPRETENAPTEVLRAIVRGQFDPAASVAGARVLFRSRPTKWQDAVALRVAGIRDGVVSIDLESDHGAVLDVPFGENVRCWKFRTA